MGLYRVPQERLYTTPRYEGSLCTRLLSSSRYTDPWHLLRGVTCRIESISRSQHTHLLRRAGLREKKSGRLQVQEPKARGVLLENDPQTLGSDADSDAEMQLSHLVLLIPRSNFSKLCPQIMTLVLRAMFPILILLAVLQRLNSIAREGLHHLSSQGLKSNNPKSQEIPPTLRFVAVS